MTQGDELKNLILEKGFMTHKSFYDEVGITRAGFYNLTTGKSKPSARTVRNMAKVLNCSMERIYNLLYGKQDTLKP